MNLIENIVNRNLNNLFNEAKQKGGIHYFYTLLRVQGLEHRRDLFLEIQDWINNYKESKDNILDNYIYLQGFSEPLELLANLINCLNNDVYNISPFSHLIKGNFLNTNKPRTVEIASELATTLSKNNQYIIIAKILNLIYFNIDENTEKSTMQNGYKKCLIFLNCLIKIYFDKRLSLKNEQKFYKLPHFEVLELMTDDKFGLVGFKIHFSNSSNATFIRYEDHTEIININPEVPISFFCGNMDELKHKWMVGTKNLYEVDFPGKYNQVGEWHPIVFPGNVDLIEKEISQISDDPTLQAQLFYMMCTGYSVIEFVVAMNLELPHKNSIMGDNIHFHKCNHNNMHENNEQIYDCWIELKEVNPEIIKTAINTINIAINRLAFTYNIRAKWCLKYTSKTPSGSKATPKKKDLWLINKILKEFPTNEDQVILDAAIDWFNQGKNSKNTFTKFLCYYIAIESLALEIADGKEILGINIEKINKPDKIKQKLKCIDKLHNTLYENDPIKFVNEAYFNCVITINKKLKLVLTKVFGENHKYINYIFDKKQNPSLSEIRSKLAHGEFNLLSDGDKNVVQNNLHLIENISEDFIKRLVLGLKYNEPISLYTGGFSSSLTFGDPRVLKVVTHENLIKNKNWKIRSEWIE